MPRMGFGLIPQHGGKLFAAFVSFCKRLCRDSKTGESAGGQQPEGLTGGMAHDVRLQPFDDARVLGRSLSLNIRLFDWTDLPVQLLNCFGQPTSKSDRNGVPNLCSKISL